MKEQERYSPSLAAAGEGWGGGRWQQSGGNSAIYCPPRRGHPQKFAFAQGAGVRILPVHPVNPVKNDLSPIRT